MTDRVLCYPAVPSIIVNGGRPLSGSVAASGSKNASLPVLAACLLNDQPVVLENVPRLHDVEIICEVLRALGATISPVPRDHERSIDSSSVNSTEPPYELVRQMRASFLVLGPLLARFHEASVPLPGGCNIGPRPVNEHLSALEALGAEIVQESGRIVARADRLVGTEISMNIVSVGATENAVMAASLAEGVTTIYNASSDPDVVDLCDFLIACGVGIEGAGTKKLVIHGQEQISRAVSYRVSPDRIEAGTFLLALAATGGDGIVRNVEPEHLEPLLHKLQSCGIELEIGDDTIRVVGNGPFRATNIETAPHPGFPTDLQPQMSVLLSAADGVSTVTEHIFEKRLSHVPELMRMGAKMQVHGESIFIEGQRGALAGVPVEAHDLRCAAALVIAGLMASGETRIDGLEHLVRGYEALPDKMSQLGGDVRFDLDHETAAATG